MNKCGEEGYVSRDVSPSSPMMEEVSLASLNILDYNLLNLLL